MSDLGNLSCLPLKEPSEEPENPEWVYPLGRKTQPVLEENEDKDGRVQPNDQLRFQPEEKCHQHLKQIRDLVNKGTTIVSAHDPNCKGLCSKCCGNLNLLDVSSICREWRRNLMAILKVRESRCSRHYFSRTASL